MRTPSFPAGSPKKRLTEQLARLDYRTRRIGWPYLAGGILILLAIVLHFTVVREARHEVESARNRIDKAGRLAAAPQDKAPSAAQSQFDALYRFFPKPQARGPALIRIYTLAGEQGLSLESGDYREILADALQKSSAAGLGKYQLSLPLRGTYPALRAWLAAVMNEMPAVALEDFSLKRNATSSPVVEARVLLTLYFAEH